MGIKEGVPRFYILRGVIDRGRKSSQPFSLPLCVIGLGKTNKNKILLFPYLNMLYRGGKNKTKTKIKISLFPTLKCYIEVEKRKKISLFPFL